MNRNPFAGTARVGWMEFRAHLKSPRLIVLVVLVALLVLGVSYGASQSPTSTFSTTPSLSVHAAIRNESGTDHYLIVAWLADVRGVPRSGVSVSIYSSTFVSPYGGTNETYIGAQDTNGTGFVVFDLGTSVPANVSYMLRSGGQFMGMMGFSTSPTNATFTAAVGTASSYSPLGSVSVTTVHVMTSDGYPATGASVLLDGALQGHPDANGFYSMSLPEGEHTLNVTYQGYSESYFVFGHASSGPTYENGADFVLLMMSLTFLPLVLPIAAIAVSFDAIARERAQGTLEVLLARRVRREGVVMGKFLGAFTAVAVPVALVLLAGVGVLTWVSGKTPTTTLAVTVLVSSLFLVAVYTLLMLLFSTLAKSVGTAVVFGVVVWLFFALFFSVLTTLLFVSTGGSLLDPGVYNALLATQLLDPNMIFQMLVGLALPVTGGSSGLISTGYLSPASIVAAGVAWIVVLLLLTVWVFRRKAES